MLSLAQHMIADCIVGTLEPIYQAIPLPHPLSNRSFLTYQSHSLEIFMGQVLISHSNV